MKKNLLRTASVLLITLLVITACQKNASEKVASSSESQGKSVASLQSNNSGCKLTHEEFPGSVIENISYNNNGQVDYLREVAPPAYSVDAKISYLPNGHISRADIHYMTKVQYGGEVKEYELFTYEGDKITKISEYYAATNELDLEDFVTYNANNQPTRFDVPGYGWSFRFSYDAMSDPTRYEFYLNDFLTGYTNWDHAKYIKNPELLLVSSGLPFDILSPFIQDFPQLASGRTSYFWDEESSSYVPWLSFQSQNTTVTTNSFGNPETVKIFDEISGKEVKLTYNYTNCGNGNQSQSSQSVQTNDSSNNERILSKAERLDIIKNVMMARIQGANKTTK